MNKCRAALLGGILTAGIANLLGAAAVGPTLVGQLSQVKPVLQCAFWLAVTAMGILSAIGGALGGAVAAGCFEPPPGGGGGGGGGGNRGPDGGRPPHGGPGGSRAMRVVILLTFIPTLGGAAIAIVELLASRNTFGVLSGFIVDEVGTIAQLMILLPIVYRALSRMLQVNAQHFYSASSS